MLCPCTTAYAVEKDVCLSPGLVKSMLSRFDITAIDDTGKETKKYTAADKCDKDAFKKTILALEQINTVSIQKSITLPMARVLIFLPILMKRLEK
jgi:hypothetical protein